MQGNGNPKPIHGIHIGKDYRSVFMSCLTTSISLASTILQVRVSIMRLVEDFHKIQTYQVDWEI